eukprot:gene16857-biopygen9783
MYGASRAARALNCSTSAGTSRASPPAATIASLSTVARSATVAAKAGGYVVGYTNDWSTIEPDAWASSFLYNWGPYYVSQVQAVIDGTWEPAISFGGLKDDFIDFAPYGPAVTPEILALVEEAKAGIIDGSLDIFAGPISDNAGNVVIAEGETVPFETRTECCQWLVEGVVGEIPA